VQDNHTPNPNYTLIGISTHFLPPPELATRPDRRPWLMVVNGIPLVLDRIGWAWLGLHAESNFVILRKALAGSKDSVLQEIDSPAFSSFFFFHTAAAGIPQQVAISQPFAPREAHKKKKEEYIYKYK